MALSDINWKAINVSGYITRKEAAAYLGISYQTIQRWEKKYSNFPRKKVGRSYRYKIADLDKWMSEELK